MQNTVKWSGYEFWVYDPAKTTWKDVAGIYIFAGITPENRWRAYYIGQASSFSDRLANHERWNEAVRLGATHVHSLVVPLQAHRDAIEAQLIRNHGPRLNTHGK